MNYKVQGTLNKFSRFDGFKIRIESEAKSFDIICNETIIPHILGLHYMQSNYRQVKGIQMLNYVKHNNLSDEDIYNKVEKSNPSKLHNVKERIRYFSDFMENLEYADIVEMTNKKTKLNSNYLAIQTSDNKILQLGIASIAGVDYLETFLISANEHFFENTKMYSKVTGIYKYDEDYELIPFSFNQEKANRLYKKYIDSKIKESIYEDSTIENEQEFEL